MSLGSAYLDASPCWNEEWAAGRGMRQVNEDMSLRSVYLTASPRWNKEGIGEGGEWIYFSSWNEEGAGENGFTSDPEIRSGQRFKWPGTENESGSYPCRHALDNGNHETWSAKLSEEKLTRSEAPQNRDKWRDIVVTSCTTRDEQEWVSKQRIRRGLFDYSFRVHNTRGLAYKLWRVSDTKRLVPRIVRAQREAA